MKVGKSQIEEKIIRVRVDGGGLVLVGGRGTLFGGTQVQRQVVINGIRQQLRRREVVT